ncbi:hypothetical protein SAMN05421788_105227 [Filimonas lacunae]|uniref:Lipoprotein n=2 Tax=Filimonas lacunae TaxID=477680 RepID=A0A173MCR6_9BACT|nr:hypothetical protein FLA_1324 [Filimonas lacunae]SIT22022.1 hypothetical protein SAMN05421788_105227 [Filimonas lacunae]
MTMKTIRAWAVLPMLAIAVLSGCSKSNDDVATTDGACFADKLELSNPVVEDLPSSHSVIITYDVKNTSSEDFDIQKGHRPVYVKVSATTTSDKVYTEENLLTVSSLSAGSTTSTKLLVDYGAGNAYKSYSIDQKICK